LTQHTLILGLGLSGESCLRHLAAGDRLTVVDSRQSPPNIRNIQQGYPQVDYHLGVSELPQGSFDRVIVSPGIADDHPLLLDVLSHGLALLSDIDLFCQQAQAPIYAITGTNGKSTVTSLIGAMLSAQGDDVGVGGNLGTPALDLLSPTRQAYVLELSSFQLQRLAAYPFAAATVLNISEDHLDRHGDLATYRVAKQRIYAGAGLAVFNRDDALTLPVRTLSDQQQLSFGNSKPATGQYGIEKRADESVLMLGESILLSTRELAVAGSHNALNVQAALAMTHNAPVSLAARCRAAREFTGLPHRGNLVCEVNQVRFVNDSKATNVGATIAALQGLAAGKNLLILLGGQSKGASLKPLAAVVANCCSHALVFGEAAAELQQVLAGVVDVRHVSSLAEAVTLAYQLAQPGQIVLLSPACASFDMFANFSDRGDQFVRLAQALAA